MGRGGQQKVSLRKNGQNLRESEKKITSCSSTHFVQEGKSKEEDLSQEKGGQVRGGRQQTARLSGFAREGGGEAAGRASGEPGRPRGSWGDGPVGPVLVHSGSAPGR